MYFFWLIYLVVSVTLVSAFVAIPPPYVKNIRPIHELTVSRNLWEIFEQSIDHNDSAAGIFQQRYWWSTEFWEGPGSPIILFTPGEVPVLGTNGDFTGYLGNVTLVGQYAQAVGGAAIIIEHRYFGESSPFSNLTPENLEYMTAFQAIQDMVSFARNAELPFDVTGQSNAPESPWVFVGGSYAGALAAWIEVTSPGTFWASHASSAPVQSIQDYWQYFYSIYQGMATNCSTDIQSIVEQVDTVLTNGTSLDQEILKAEFGLGIVVHADDFARTISLPLELWQNGIPSFLPFCDAIEGAKAGHIPSPQALGVTSALPNYARFVNQNYGCTSFDCYDSYNVLSDLYANTTIDPNALGGRQWQWMLCHEGFGWWQTGAPIGQTTLVSRFVTTAYFEQECGFYFPGVEFTRTAADNNLDFMGWDISNTTRLMFSNGQFDPWRSAGVSSEFRPSGPVPSTSEMPIILIPGAVHTQDLYMASITSYILHAQSQEVAQIVNWIKDFYQQTLPGNNSSSSSTCSSTSSVISSHTVSSIYSTTYSSTTTSISSPTTSMRARTRSSSITSLPSFSLTATRTVIIDPPQATKLVGRSPNIPLQLPPRPSARTSNPYFAPFASLIASRTPVMKYTVFTEVPVPPNAA